MLLSAWNIGVVVFGYLLALAIGHFITGSVINRLWNQYVPSLQRHPNLPAIIGALDIFLFISSYLLGFPEFIAIWLAIKVAGEWSPSKSDVDRPLYHIFLIGNGMNLIVSVGLALLIQYLIR